MSISLPQWTGFQSVRDDDQIVVIRDGVVRDEFLTTIRRASRRWENTRQSRGSLHGSIEAPSGSRWFVKQYHHGGILADSGDVYYSRPRRFFREIRATEQARNARINVPTPIGVLANRTADGWVGFYVSEFVPGESLSRPVRVEQQTEYFRHAGRTLAHLHALGLDPKDVHIHNLRVDHQKNLLFTDFDPVDFVEPSAWKRGLRIHRFARSLSKHGFLEEDRDSFRNGYESAAGTQGWIPTIQRPLFATKHTLSDLRYVWRGDRSWTPKDREKVLVRVPNWLGDNIMALPLLQTLSADPETGPVHVLVRENLQELYQHIPSVERVWTLPSDKTYSTPDGLCEQRYSLALAVPKSLRTGIQLWRTGIPRRVGFNTQGRGWCLTDRVELDGRDRTMHHARLYRELVRDILPLPDELPLPRLNVKPEAIANTQQQFSLPADYLVVHPGSAYGPAKRWPAQRFRAALQQVLDKWSLPIVAVGVAAEQSIADEVLRDLPADSFYDLVGETSLGQCIDVLSGATATVANDSGIMHLSSALGTPTVGIFGSSTPELTSPLGPRHTVIYRDVDCSPCFKRTCPLDEDRYRCLTKIAPDTVIHSLNQWIGE